MGFDPSFIFNWHLLCYWTRNKTTQMYKGFCDVTAPQRPSTVYSSFFQLSFLPYNDLAHLVERFSSTLKGDSTTLKNDEHQLFWLLLSPNMSCLQIKRQWILLQNFSRQVLTTLSSVSNTSLNPRKVLLILKPRHVTLEWTVLDLSRVIRF